MPANRRYSVYMSLAGHTASRKWCRDYAYLGAAKRFCLEWCGYGRSLSVVDNTTGNTVHTIHNVPA